MLRSRNSCAKTNPCQNWANIGPGNSLPHSQLAGAAHVRNSPCNVKFQYGPCLSVPYSVRSTCHVIVIINDNTDVQSTQNNPQIIKGGDRPEKVPYSGPPHDRDLCVMKMVTKTGLALSRTNGIIRCSATP